MSFSVPEEIIKNRKLLEDINQAAEDLRQPRGKLIEACLINEAEMSEVEEILAQHSRLLSPIQEIHSLFRSALESLRAKLKERLDKEEAAGNGKKFKEGKWYTVRKDFFDDLADDTNSAFNLQTDLDYFVSDLESKIKRLQTKEKKQAFEAQAKQVQSSETSEDDEEQSVQLDTPERSSEGTSGTDFNLASVQESACSQPKTPQMWLEEITVESSAPKARLGQSKPKDIITQEFQLEAELNRRDKLIEELRGEVEMRKSESQEYKKNYNEQKQLTSKAEDEIQRLREERNNWKDSDSNGKSLRRQIEANQKELLNAIKQGVSDVTIEVLRANQR